MKHKHKYIIQYKSINGYSETGKISTIKADGFEVKNGMVCFMKNWPTGSQKIFLAININRVNEVELVS